MEPRLVAAARAAGPLILDRREETEAMRRLPKEIVAELIEARMCRMGLPAENAGLDVAPVEWLQALEVLAGFEASVPWIAWNNALVCLFSRFLPAAERERVFADPTWLYAQSTRPSGRAVVEGDAFRVSGRWSLVSGCELARWLLLHCVVEENGRSSSPDNGDETRFVFVERSAADVLDTWNSGGLRGSGSHDVTLSDVRVSRQRSVSPSDASTLDAPIGRVPIICNLIAGFAAQALGIAQTALDTVVALARAPATGPGPALRDRPAAQADVARYSSATAAARSHLHGCVSTLWQRASSGGAPSLDEIRDTTSASLYATEVSARTVEAMVAAAGTRGLYTDLPLERGQRDLHVMLRHIVAQPAWLEDAGRVSFGLPPSNPQFEI